MITSPLILRSIRSRPDSCVGSRKLGFPFVVIGPSLLSSCWPPTAERADGEPLQEYLSQARAFPLIADPGTRARVNYTRVKLPGQ